MPPNRVVREGGFKSYKPVVEREVRHVKLVIGQAVTYVDSHGVERPAIVTQVWSGMSGGADGCNLVVVATDESKTDQYGRQLERYTSVAHQSSNPAPGNYWK
jgi:hypothetical protein